MKLLAFFFLLPAFSFAQIFFGPLTEGEYYNEVVYEGTYFSPGTCTWADGTDFIMDFSGLTEINGMEYVFVVDTPAPANTTLMNGWLTVNIGDSTAFAPTTTSLGISAASNSAQINFHIRLVGTPITAGQIYPCWIDQIQTLATCDNVWQLLSGETLTPCIVQTSIGIDDLENSFSITSENGQIKIESTVSGSVKIFQVDGKLVDLFNIEPGSTRRPIEMQFAVMMIQIESERGTFSKKILLQK